MTEQIIKDLLTDNEGNNVEVITSDPYGKGYFEGYHDALGIKHNEKIYND